MGFKRMMPRLLLVTVLAVVLATSSVQSTFSSMELQYDDENWDSGKPGLGEGVATGGYLAVKFSLPTSNVRLLAAKYMIASLESFRVHVYGSDGATEVCSPLDVTPTATGWFQVDLAARNVVVSGDFWVALEYLSNFNPMVKYEGSTGNIDFRSYRIEAGGSPPNWVQQTVKDYGIRAVVGAPTGAPVRPMLVSSGSMAGSGPNFVLDLPPLGSLTFSNVLKGGTVNVYSDSGLNLVGGHIPPWAALRFENSIEFSGPVTITLDFAAEEGHSPSEYHLYQWQVNAWVDITTSVVSGGPGWGTITATTDSLGIFMVQLVPGAAPSGSPSESRQNSNPQLSVGVGILPAIGLMVLAFAGAASWSGLKSAIPHSRKRATHRRNR